MKKNLSASIIQKIKVIIGGNGRPASAEISSQGIVAEASYPASETRHRPLNQPSKSIIESEA